MQIDTGTGKTLVSAAIIKLFLRTSNARRVLFLVDRLELEDQALKALKKVLANDYKSVIYKENRDDWRHAEIVVSTVQSLLFNNKYQQLFSPTDFDLVISDEAHRSIGGKRITKRNIDLSRNDSSFVPIYLPKRNRRKFVYVENALHLNPRLVVQQGVFLCPGDTSSPLIDNLQVMDGWDVGDNVIKLSLELNDDALREFADRLKRMNVSSAVLFPGLDGFARSLGEHLFLYDLLAERRTGRKDHVTPDRGFKM